MYLFYTHHVFFFFFNDTATTEIYTLSLHDALPISLILSLPLILNSADYQALLISQAQDQLGRKVEMKRAHVEVRSEEHTSELQSRLHLVCRLLLEKKKKTLNTNNTIGKNHEQ